MTINNKTEKELQIGGVYRHYKGRNYKVLYAAKHSEDLADFVVYQALYGDFGVWIRPLDMFLESVIVNGEKMARFQFISSS